MPRQHIKGEREETRAYSRAVITHGGTSIFLAGVTGGFDSNGNSLAGDFEAQVHQTFANLRAGVEAAGGTLEDIVTMTVFITEMRYGDRFTEMRRDYFTNYPGSALIGVEALARPEMLLEIQAIAVIGDD
jgi:enamine deaminase RidA (YjgF/YER057c/UK114 family)